MKLTIDLDVTALAAEIAKHLGAVAAPVAAAPAPAAPVVPAPAAPVVPAAPALPAAPASAAPGMSAPLQEGVDALTAFIAVYGEPAAGPVIAHYGAPKLSQLNPAALVQCTAYLKDCVAQAKAAK